MKPCFFTPRSAQDLDNIYEYIAQDSPYAAENFIDLLEKECNIISKSPEIGRPREELQPKLRSLPVGNHVIFYRSQEKIIEIIRILHGARDIPPLFQHAGKTQ